MKLLKISILAAMIAPMAALGQLSDDELVQRAKLFEKAAGWELESGEFTVEKRTAGGNGSCLAELSHSGSSADVTLNEETGEVVGAYRLSADHKPYDYRGTFKNDSDVIAGAQRVLTSLHLQPLGPFDVEWPTPNSGMDSDVVICRTKQPFPASGAQTHWANFNYIEVCFYLGTGEVARFYARTGVKISSAKSRIGEARARQIGEHFAALVGKKGGSSQCLHYYMGFSATHSYTAAARPSERLTASERSIR